MTTAATPERPAVPFPVDDVIAELIASTHTDSTPYPNLAPPDGRETRSSRARTSPTVEDVGPEYRTRPGGVPVRTAILVERFLVFKAAQRVTPATIASYEWALRVAPDGSDLRGPGVTPTAASAVPTSTGRASRGT